MANGIINLTKTGSGLMYGRIVWESTANGTEANTSTVTATIQVSREAGSTTTGTWRGNLTVGSTTKSFNEYKAISGSWVTLCSITSTVNHSANGSGDCDISGKINGPTETTMQGTSVSGSETITLDTIPRQAVLETATDFLDTENPVITYTNPLGAAVPSLQAGISLTGTSDCEIAYRNIDKTAGRDTLDLTEAERDIIRAATEGKNYRTVWIYLRTRIGETYYYSPNSVRFTIADPKPIISPTIRDTNQKTIDLTGDDSKLIKYYSNAAVTIGAQAVKKASITSQKVTCGAKSLTANGTITAVESDNFVFTVTDDRGNTTTVTKKPEMVEYIKLSCSQENTRPNVNGTIIIRAKGKCFTGSFGAVTNSITAKVTYKENNGAYGSPVTMTVTKQTGIYEATAEITGLDTEKTYVFKVTVSDLLSSASSDERPVKLMPVFDWSGDDFKFNVPVSLVGYTNTPESIQITQTGTTDALLLEHYESMAAASIKVVCLKQSVQDSLPVGGTWFVTMYKTSASYGVMAAIRYLTASASVEYRKTLYAGTWSGWDKVITAANIVDAVYPVGSYYISHNDTSPASLFGGTWHRIESRFLWGAPATSELGKTAGEMTHTLTVSELPSHGHNLIRPKWYAVDGDGEKSTIHNSSTGSIYGTTSTTTATYKDVNSASVEKTGGGAAHNNMPPYVTVAIWRRTA